jgi:hypothetical protein
MTRVTSPAELGRSVPTGQQYLTPAALAGPEVLARSGSVDPSAPGTQAPAGGCTDGRPGGRPDVQRSSRVLAELGRSPIRPGPGRRPAQTAAPVRLGPGARPPGVRAFARSARGACPVGFARFTDATPTARIPARALLPPVPLASPTQLRTVFDVPQLTPSLSVSVSVFLPGRCDRPKRQSGAYPWHLWLASDQRSKVSRRSLLCVPNERSRGRGACISRSANLSPDDAKWPTTSWIVR